MSTPSFGTPPDDDTAQERPTISERDAILALAQVVNFGGDETSRQTLADYQAQQDRPASTLTPSSWGTQTEPDAGADDNGDSEQDDDTGTSEARSAADKTGGVGRRARQG